MPLMGKPVDADEQIKAWVWLTKCQAINAKLGEAAKPSQSAASRDFRVSETQFLAKMDIVIFNLPIGLC
jgi:hypothetical protein